VANNIHFPIIASLLPKDDPRYKKWLMSLKRRPPPWNKGKTKDTDYRVKKISVTFRRKEIDNFAVWRENARKQGLIPSSYQEFSKDVNLAFIIGLILGDGNLYKFPRTECLRIVLGTDKPLLLEYAQDIMHKVFSKEPRIRKRKNSECADIVIYQQHLGERLGIPIGARGKLPIKLPKWVWRNKEFLIGCLKGLFEAEGSFSIHLATYTYNLSFSNRNTSLLDEVEKALYLLGFHPERRYNAVRLRKKIEAFNFVELIQFRKYNLI